MPLKPHRLKGIYTGKNALYTINLVPGTTAYDERKHKEAGKEYREWNPKKSKLAAGLMKGISQIGIMPGKTVLYLGCSTGTTCSHISDILGKDGFLWGVDPAPRVMREFVFLAEERPNIAPILADANHPEEYEKHVPQVDIVFQDIAQRHQVDIFLKNCEKFLKPGGFGLLAVKARSIDVTKKPKTIFKDVLFTLEDHYPVVDQRELAPYELDHCMYVIKKK